MASPLPAATRARYPSWVLLDTNAYFDEGVNSTTAHAVTRAGNAVRVTFCLASPPFVSHICLSRYYCPGLVGAKVVSSAKDLVLLRFGSAEYFVYQATGNNPSSLRPIPSIHPDVDSPPCIFPCDDDDGEFFVADLSDALGPERYVLDVFSSKTNKWVTRPLQLQASPAMTENIPRQHDKVVALGGGAVGWFDLWRGIIVCDNVLDENPVLRVVPLPSPGFGFDLRRGTGTGQKEEVRDVTFCGGFIKLVEVDCRFKEVLVNGNANKNSFKTTYDLDAEDTIYDSELLLQQGEFVPTEDEEYSLVLDGWKIRTCYRHISWDYWRKGHVVDADDITVCNPEHCKMLPQLWDLSAGTSALRNLVVSYPTLSTRGDDVVYLMSKLKINDQSAWMVGVDLGKKTVEVVENIVDYFQPPFLSCSFSEYLNTTPRNVL
jgi:hypothetical protein